MRHLTSLVAIFSSFALTACASIIEGGTDHINVVPQPSAGNTSCTFTNAREKVTAVIPSSVTIKKSRSDIDVACVDSTTQAKGNSKIVSDIEPWVFGNVIIGGLIGLGVDWATGAAYNYPNDAVVPMTTQKADALPPETLPAIAPASGAPEATIAPAVAPALAPAAIQAPAPAAAPEAAPAPTATPAQ